MERTIKLRPYQEAVIERSVKAILEGKGVIINSPTGTGKTIMGLMIGVNLGFPFDVYVRTRSQYTPWEENARKLGLTFTGLMAKSLFCSMAEKEYAEVCEICGISKEESKNKSSDHVHKWKRIYYNYNCKGCKVIRVSTTNPYFASTLQQKGIYKFAVDSKNQGLCAYPDMLGVRANFRIFSYLYYFFEIVLPNPVIIFDEAHNLELQELMRTVVYVKDFISLSKSKMEQEVLKWAFRRFLETESCDAEVKDILGNRVTIKDLLLRYGIPGREVLGKCKRIEEADDSYFKEKTDTYYRIIARDPSKILSRLNGKRYVLLSGTMPSEKYIREVWGLEQFEYIDVLRDYYEYLKDFYHMNISIVDADVTFKNRNDVLYKDIAEFIKQHLRKDGINLVATTSKQMMKDLSQFLHADFMEKDGKIDFEKLQRLPDGAVVLAYEGGRLTEGIEIVKDGVSRIKAVFIVGFPYPEYKDKYLNSVIDYLAQKKGLQGEAKESFRWFILKEKAIIKVRQTMGRAVRSPQDEADIWLIDKRFRYKDIAERLNLEVDENE